MCYSALVETDLKKLMNRFSAEIYEEAFNLLQSAQEKDSKYKAMTGTVFPNRPTSNYYAPIIADINGELKIVPARYGLYLTPKGEALAKRIQEREKQPANNYNTMSDNLENTFTEKAIENTGAIQLKAFKEWVLVRDLIAKNAISLKEVEAFFEEGTEKRKQKILEEGKKYKPTLSEQKKIKDRKLVVIFTPEDVDELNIPILYSMKTNDAGFMDRGFSIVTGDPLPSVNDAGHDRSPKILHKDDIDEWLQSGNQSTKEKLQIVERGIRPKFRVQIFKN